MHGKIWIYISGQHLLHLFNVKSWKMKLKSWMVKKSYINITGSKGMCHYLVTVMGKIFAQFFLKFLVALTHVREE